MGQEDARHGAPSALASTPRPFGDTVVTAWHVERPETRRVLGELERRIARQRQSGALVAEPGLGRTHLARVFSERIDPIRWQCVWLPQGRFDFDDLCRTVVAGAGGGLVREGPDLALRRLLHEAWSEGRSMLVIIDDADSMSADTAARWANLMVQQVPTLLSLFVVRSRSAPCVVSLEDGAPVVELHAPLSPPETVDYVLDRLSRARVESGLLERFDELAVEQLAELSGGMPTRLHALASMLLDLPAESLDEVRSRFAAAMRPLSEPAPETPEEPGEPKRPGMQRVGPQAEAAQAAGEEAERVRRRSRRRSRRIR